MSENLAATAVPDIAADAVLVTSEEMPAGAEKVQVRIKYLLSDLILCASSWV